MQYPCKIVLFIGICLLPMVLPAQNAGAWEDNALNTARTESYMLPSEREMLYEINRLRSDPKRYGQLLLPRLEEAKANLESHGLGTRSYSIGTTYHYIDGKPTAVREDTTWHDRYQEEVDAIEGLIRELDTMAPMPILQPDRGIYTAASRHASDEQAHDWELGHLGSDDSWPSDRIRRHSPQMADGNENIAGSGCGGKDCWVSPREIVLLLLIDSGIPGYGHRYNLLNRKWTHGACKYGGFSENMHRWIQNFGQVRE